MAKKKSKRKKPVYEDDTLTPSYLTSYEITEEPIMEPAYRRLPNSVKDRIEELYEEVQRNPELAIPELLELKKKYPKVPQIYNYLAVAYSYARDYEKVEQITQENMRKNPNYLFARINQAQLYLQKKEYDKIPALFNHRYDLQALYPKRKKFHISEVANFMGVMGLYFAKTDQRETSEKYHDILQQIASDFPIAKALKRELHPGLLTRLAQRLLGEPPSP